MFQRLIVPLDGSELAEAALPYAIWLAVSLGSHLILLRAAMARALPGVDPVHGQVEVVAEAERYLQRVEKRLRGEGLTVRCVVPYGDAAEMIVAEARVHRADGIVMATHGQSGPSPWGHGSVADKVLRASPTPVLLVHATEPSGDAANPAGNETRCQHCGRGLQPGRTAELDRCPRCGYPLHSCANCSAYDGIVCSLGNSWQSDIYVANRCPDFQFRHQQSRDGSAAGPPAE